MLNRVMTPNPIAADAELVHAALAGDREAFAGIVGRYQSLICSLAYSATGDLSRSEDLAQETFVAAWRHLLELREPVKLRAWLCGIARNVISHHRRAERREPVHDAVVFETLAEARSPEPPPAERVISREEAGLLWSALERLPESYRVPLVLFYREHQSVDTVARSLELSEDTVRQRLSRGRKLLETEVLRFVEATLTRSAPDSRFTFAVLAALPGPATSLKVAGAGAVLAKSGAGAKTATTLGWLGGAAAMLGAVLFSWKTVVDESRSLRERRLMIRLGWWLIAWLVAAQAVAFVGLPRLAANRPALLAPALAATILVNLVACVLMSGHLGRRLAEIRAEEGTLLPGPEARPVSANRRAFRLIVPGLILLAGGSVGLPWSMYPGRSAGVVLVEILVVLWGFGRFRRLSRSPGSGAAWPGANLPPPSRGAATRRPAALLRFVLLPGILLGSAILAGLLPFFLNPGAGPGAREQAIRWLQELWPWLLAALVVYAALATWLFRRGRRAPDPAAVLDQLYEPLLQELNLPAETGRRLKALVLEKTSALATRTVARLNGPRDVTSREAFAARLRQEQLAHEARIAALLGEAGHAALRRFERSIPDRTLVRRMQERLQRGPHALSAEQVTQLLRALGEARERFPWTNALGRRAITESPDWAALFTTANLGAWADEEERFAREFLEGAGPILGFAQLRELEAELRTAREVRVREGREAARLFAEEG